MQRTVKNLAVALVAGTFAFAAGAQDKGEKAAKKASAAASASGGKVVVNGVAIPQSRIDAMNRELTAQGQPDTPERHNAVTAELVNGGDLDWGPSARYVKPFADAITSMQKGQTTATPVKTDFGYHVIRLDDTRPLKVPEFNEIKEQFRQRAQQQQIQKLVMDLRTKAKVEEK